MFFKNFPSIQYPSGNGELQEIKDILLRVAFSDDVKDKGAIFSEYTVSDNQTPEKIAEEVYGDQQYHWVVLLFNDILDPIYDFPLKTRSLDSFIDKKYPSKTLFLSPVGSTQEFYTHYFGGTSDVDNFKEGDTITVFVDYNDYKDTGNDVVTGIVKKFIPELSAIELHTLGGNLKENDIVVRGYNTEIRARVNRIVDSRYAVHHFEENGVILNPYGTPPDSQGNQVTLGQTSSNYLQPVGTTQTILENYINDKNSNYVVTNEEYESVKNLESKKIKLLNPVLLESVTRDLRKVLNR